MWSHEHCRIGLSHFLANCRKMRLNQGSFGLHCMLFELYLVCVFYCTVKFVSIIQVIGYENDLQTDLDCVRWGVFELCLNSSFVIKQFSFHCFEEEFKCYSLFSHL